MPDPFGEYESFAAHNNAMLRRFLDGFGFDYEFASSTDYYTSGRFDAALLHMLRSASTRCRRSCCRSLREERAATYSPFLPIHPRHRRRHAGAADGRRRRQGRRSAGAIPAPSEDFETPVTGGHCKLQWKPDWAMRWYALKVDYEMAGKDLIDSVKLSSRIVRALGGEPPEGFNYELFLDDKGQKISKSKGNGLTIDEWLTYASPESLALFMFQKPTAAKRLHFDVIPRTVDDYLRFLDAYPRQEWKERLGNPVWHIHSGAPPRARDARARRRSRDQRLVRDAAQPRGRRQQRQSGGAVGLPAPLRAGAPRRETHPRLDRLVGYACAYFRDFVAPKKRYRAADEVERAALEQVSALLGALPADASAEAIQTALYDVARPIPRYQDLKAKGATPERPGVSNEFFNMIYAVLLGEERGPRLGSFIALYGIAETRALIAKALAGDLLCNA